MFEEANGYGCESYQALAGLVVAKAPGPGETFVKGVVIVIQKTNFFRVVYSKVVQGESDISDAINA